MLDFETPTYITAKESQQMQSGVSPTKCTTQQTHHQAVKDKLCPHVSPAFCYPKVVPVMELFIMWSLKCFCLRNLTVHLH